MNRFIDADALFDAMEKTEWYDNADRDEIAERLIMDAPTIDIVRCEECKYWNEGKCWNMKGLNKTDGTVKADDFCSYGKVSEIPTGSERSSE